VGFLYRLTYTDGEDAGEAELPASSIRIGDEIRIDSNALVRVTKVVPVERIGEFVDGAVYGLLEVEPVDPSSLITFAGSNV
jgi:hypothetical protein